MLATEIAPIDPGTGSHRAVHKATGHSTLAEIIWLYAAEFSRDGDIALQNDHRSPSSKSHQGEPAYGSKNRLQDSQYDDRTRSARQLLRRVRNQAECETASPNLAVQQSHVESISEATHDRGLAVCERYRFSIYDSMIVASALLASCRVLYSEDLNDGQLIDDQLTIRDPFSMK